MRAYLRFKTNRPITSKDFVSPGSYTFVLTNGEKRQIDFNESNRTQKADGTVEYELCDLDTTYEDGDKFSINDIPNIASVEEIFIGISDEDWRDEPHDTLTIDEVISFDFCDFVDGEGIQFSIDPKLLKDTVAVDYTV